MGNINIGEKIRVARRNKCMTQKKLAESIGCKSSFVSHIERNSRNLSLAYFQRISEALETPAYRLMAPEGDKAIQLADQIAALSPESFNLVRQFVEFLAGQELEKEKQAADV